MQTSKLLTNPFHYTYFFPTLWVVIGFLGLSLLLLLAIKRFDVQALRQSSLFQRWRVWAMIAPIFGLALMCGQLTTLLLIWFLVVQGLREFSHLVGLNAWYSRLLLVAGVLAAPAALISIDAFYSLAPVLLILATIEPLLLPEKERSIRHFAFAVLGWGYIALFLGYMMLIYKYIPGGIGVLLAMGLGVALSDVGAFTVGKQFGRHKMAPTLSPNKTWEGVAGNLLGAYFGIGIMSFALPPGLKWWVIALFPALIALGSIWGDLLESSIKREFQVKDAGGWLPGFGGLLDRIDSLIMVLPLAYYFLRVAGKA